MATVTDRTAVSVRFALLFRRLARRAAGRGDVARARMNLLAAVADDPTPASSIEFAEFLGSHGHRQDGLLVLHDAWELAKRRGNGCEVAECCRLIAIAYRGARNSHLAKRFAERAADAEMMMWGLGDGTWSAEQLQLEALLALDERDLARARSLAAAAVEVCVDDVSRSGAMGRLAVIDLAMGRAVPAAKILLKAARLAREAGADRGYAECVLQLGHTLRGMGRLPGAVACYRVAVIRFERAGRLADAQRARRWGLQTAAIEKSRRNAEWN
jgi:tetratricopeptide (TPR) repeat protein